MTEIEKLKSQLDKCFEALKMWAKFWEADNDENSLEPLLAEEAMELTREILGEQNG